MLKLDISTLGKKFDAAEILEPYSGNTANLDSRHKCILKRYDVIENWPENHSIFVITKGVAGLQNILSDGRRSILALFIAKDMIDSSLCQSTKSGCLIALTNLEGFWVEDATCGKSNAMCSNHLLAFRQSMIQQNKFMIRHCNDLGKKSAIEKIAAFMFECRHRVGQKNNNRIPLLLQRVDIADYLGLRQETLSRAIAKLERNKLIKIIDGNLVKILDLKCLRQIANGASELRSVPHE